MWNYQVQQLKIMVCHWAFIFTQIFHGLDFCLRCSQDRLSVLTSRAGHSTEQASNSGLIIHWHVSETRAYQRASYIWLWIWQHEGLYLAATDQLGLDHFISRPSEKLTLAFCFYFDIVLPEINGMAQNYNTYSTLDTKRGTWFVYLSGGFRLLHTA